MNASSIAKYVTSIVVAFGAGALLHDSMRQPRRGEDPAPRTRIQVLYGGEFANSSQYAGVSRTVYDSEFMLRFGFDPDGVANLPPGFHWMRLQVKEYGSRSGQSSCELSAILDKSLALSLGDVGSDITSPTTDKFFNTLRGPLISKEDRVIYENMIGFRPTFSAFGHAQIASEHFGPDIPNSGRTDGVILFYTQSRIVPYQSVSISIPCHMSYYEAPGLSLWLRRSGTAVRDSALSREDYVVVPLPSAIVAELRARAKE